VKLNICPFNTAFVAPHGYLNTLSKQMNKWIQSKICISSRRYKHKNIL